MSKLGFGELELIVLKILRELGRATVRDVHEKLKNGSSYTTIMTVMSRLANKGDLKKEKVGKQYIYWLTPSNDSSSKNILRRIQEKIFGGKPTAMISYLLDTDESISERDLDEMEQLIQKRRLEKKNG